MVAVDGIDGSGKSRFAVGLAAACAAQGLRAVVLHVDDFRRPVRFDGLDPAAEAAAYYERYYDFPALDDCLSAFLADAAGVRVPRFDGASGRIDGERDLSFDEASVAIIEGVFVLRARLLAGAPLVVLEVGREEARRRIVERDRARGRSEEEIARRIDRRYFPAHERYRAGLDPALGADVVIDNGDWAKPRVLRRETARFPAPIGAAFDLLLASAS
jgi:uridine kinase